jgi:hypothetical protein
MQSKLAIFGFQRSATKLLANILTQGGYHSFGEFFDAYSSNVVGDTATRLPVDLQLSNRRLYKSEVPFMFTYFRTIEARERLLSFTKLQQPTLSVVTVWSDDFDLLPDLFTQLRDRHFLCTRRKNKLDQLLSYFITKTHRNFNGEVPSTPVTIALRDFAHNYYMLQKTELFQDYLLDNNMATLIDFDELTTGKIEFGFSYGIRTVDQHSDVSSLITNIDEVNEAFVDLESRYDYGRLVKTTNFAEYLPKSL